MLKQTKLSQKPNNLNIHYVFNGFHLMFKPSIRRFVIIPLIINLLVFIGFVYLIGHGVQDFHVWFMSKVPSWLSWLGILLEIFFFFVFVTLLLYFFSIISNLIAAPFNSFLSEHVQFYLTKELLPERSYLAALKDIPRTIGRQLAIMMYYFPRMIGVLLLFIIPGVQFLAPIAWLLFNAWFTSLQYFDYPADNNRVPLHVLQEKLRDRRADTLTFGVTFSFLLLIPVFNIFVIPAAVCGATQAWVEKYN